MGKYTKHLAEEIKTKREGKNERPNKEKKI